MKKQRKTARQSNSIAADLILAPMVALMRLPLMAAEAGSGQARRFETERAVHEKTSAMAEGVFGKDAIHAHRRGRRAHAACGPGASEPAREGKFQEIVAAGLIRQRPRSRQEHGFATDTHGPSPTIHCDGNGSGTRDLIRSVEAAAMTASQSVL